MAILSLVPTPSVAATSTGSLKPGRLEIEQPAEAAQIGVGAGTPGGPGGGRDARHQRLARVDIHARVFISEAVFAGHGADSPRRMKGSASFNQTKAAAQVGPQ